MSSERLSEASKSCRLVSDNRRNIAGMLRSRECESGVISARPDAAKSIVCNLMWWNVQEASTAGIYDGAAAFQMSALANGLGADSVAKCKQLDLGCLVSHEDVTAAFDLLEDYFQKVGHLIEWI